MASNELNDDVKITAKQNLKDSVFTHLFMDKQYTIQLYKILHPEDLDVTEDKISIVTLENVLLNQPYNDLGFVVGDKLLILVEAQSTWSFNIIIRELLYAVETIYQYIKSTNQNIYGSMKVSFPEPELYVVYTGDRKDYPEQISLSEEFFGGRKISIDVTVKGIFDGSHGDIINQYVTFTKVSQEQIKLYGRTQKAVLETIRICKSQNVLKAYLESREKEVVNIMLALFSQESAVETYGIEKKIEGAVEAFRQVGWSDDQIIETIMENFKLPFKTAEAYVVNVQPA